MAVSVSIVPPASTSVSIGGETTTSVSIAKGTEGLIEKKFFQSSSSSAVSSGNLAEFKNASTVALSLRHDGVVVLKDQASAPTAVANGLYSDGADLYHGTE